MSSDSQTEITVPEFSLANENSSSSAFPLVGPYTTEFLINRVYEQLDLFKEHDERSKLILPELIVKKENKKTYFYNFAIFCEKIKREQRDVMEYLKSEFSIQASISESGTLILQREFDKKRIEKLVEKYVRAYVICKGCKSQKTQLVKEAKLLYIICPGCRSKYTVEQIMKFKDS
jgi:translation initiation factor 2 subunit 2